MSRVGSYYLMVFDDVADMYEVERTTFGRSRKSMCRRWERHFSLLGEGILRLPRSARPFVRSMALVCCVSRPAHVGRSVSGRGSGPAVPSSSTAAPRSRGLRGCARPRGEQGACAAAAVLSGGSGGGGAGGGGAHNNGGPRRRWGWGPGGDGGFKRSFLLLAATFVAGAQLLAGCWAAQCSQTLSRAHVPSRLCAAGPEYLGLQRAHARFLHPPRAARGAQRARGALRGP